MTIQVLGHGMNDQVSAQVEGTLIDWSHESVVHDHQAIRTSSMNSGADGLNVSDAKRRVGRRFDPNESGFRAQGSKNAFGTLHVNHADLNPGILGGDSVHEPIGTAVDVVDGDDMSTRPE